MTQKPSKTLSEKEGDTVFQQASKLEDAGNFDEALKLRRLLATNFPKAKLVLLTFAKSLENLNQLDEAEEYYKKAVRIAPKWELASRFLFHFLWDEDNTLWDRNRRNEAMEELRRFQTVSHSDDYMEIVREINEKSSDDSKEDTESK